MAAPHELSLDADMNEEEAMAFDCEPMIIATPPGCVDDRIYSSIRQLKMILHFRTYVDPVQSRRTDVIINSRPLNNVAGSLQASCGVRILIAVSLSVVAL